MLDWANDDKRLALERNTKDFKDVILQSFELFLKRFPGALKLVYYYEYMCAQSCLTLCDLWAVACQAPLSLEFSRQKYWSGLPFLSPGDLPDPGSKPTSLESPALTGRIFTTSTTWEALKLVY